MFAFIKLMLTRPSYIQSLEATNEGLRRELEASRLATARARNEVWRLYGILAPYGEKILKGQTADDNPAETRQVPILLPALEYEMAKAFLNVHNRISGDTWDDLLSVGLLVYCWRGRPIGKK